MAKKKHPADCHPELEAMARAFCELIDRTRSANGLAVIKTSNMREAIGLGNDWYARFKKGTFAVFSFRSFSPYVASSAVKPATTKSSSASGSLSPNLGFLKNHLTPKTVFEIRSKYAASLSAIMSSVLFRTP